MDKTLAIGGAKQYLRQIRRLDNTINAKIEQIELLRSMSTNITATLNPNRVQGSKSHDKIGKLIAKIVDFEKEIIDDVNKLIDLKREIIHKIDAVQDDNYRLLLTLRYVNCNTWEEIADEMNFTFQWVHQLHRRALINFEEIYFKDTTLDCN